MTKGSACLLLLPFLASTAFSADYPAPIGALIQRGFEVQSVFDAPGGLKGFAGRANGETLAVYLMPDGRHVVVGSMLDAGGNDLTTAQLKQHLSDPEFASAWPQLEKATWVREGSPDAKRVVYVFTDPECPYCKDFWRAAQLYLGKEVQLRHIIVGILKPTSMGKAAGILAAADPGRALIEHEMFGSKPLSSIPPAVAAKLEANSRLMQDLGEPATPAVFYKDTQGKVRRVLGLPEEQLMTSEIFQTQPRN